MPAKGQTCERCVGTCCDGRIYWVYRDQAAVAGRTHEEIMITMTAKQMRAIADEKNDGHQHDPPFKSCVQLENGRCQRHIDGTKPLLCRTWYCYGKYWQARGA